MSLGKIGEAASKACPRLVELLANKHMQFRVIDTLGQIGVKAEMAIPKLIALYQEDDYPWDRMGIVKCLAKIGRTNFANGSAISSWRRTGTLMICGFERLSAMLW